MKTSIFLFLLFGFIGFSKSQTNAEMKTHEQLLGNWKTNYYGDTWSKTAYIFTFQDSTCSFLWPYGAFSKYLINGDTLVIDYVINEIKEEHQIFKFLIDSISSTDMLLKPASKETNALFDRREGLESGIVELHKIENQFNFKPERITFISNVCMGTCPAMFLEIDSIGNFYFFGARYTEKIGNFSGKLSPEIFDRVVTEINSIELDSLQEFYEAHWTDDQTCGVLIQTKDTIYKSSAYGFDQEPVELRILFHTLMELYKNVELTEDATIEQKFQYWNFQYDAYPKPKKRE
ncbi:MAG: DUF6438 domain-containing protein [Chitinophagales bacterium]